jgi:hypothetical protein
MAGTGIKESVPHRLHERGKQRPSAPQAMLFTVLSIRLSGLTPPAVTPSAGAAPSTRRRAQKLDALNGKTAEVAQSCRQTCRETRR